MNDGSRSDPLNQSSAGTSMAPGGSVSPPGDSPTLGLSRRREAPGGEGYSAKQYP
ncbi:hypothetical protein DEO72_LG2g2858 [Vigna unguiculata]|uniref:Uncharacterized protein n=1 Tax=Vigna unguiculata TaxID=3917 RepID=A0A4D6L213_VIGUN|nr:hypothetical protein DEO72_LG2g2858 [Vigna unguiculata]